MRGLTMFQPFDPHLVIFEFRFHHIQSTITVAGDFCDSILEIFFGFADFHAKPSF